MPKLASIGDLSCVQFW